MSSALPTELVRAPLTYLRAQRAPSPQHPCRMQVQFTFLPSAKCAVKTVFRQAQMFLQKTPRAGLLSDTLATARACHALHRRCQAGPGGWASCVQWHEARPGAFQVPTLDAQRVQAARGSRPPTQAELFSAGKRVPIGEEKADRPLHWRRYAVRHL
ncbi:hypothetical protein C8Q77DRAFT_15959 [Trametes polyzona]|nr:hypothetical protein C8Q77DRAFT_15959 [Trametes polyzona]